MDGYATRLDLVRDDGLDSDRLRGVQPSTHAHAASHRGCRRDQDRAHSVYLAATSYGDALRNTHFYIHPYFYFYTDHNLHLHPHTHSLAHAHTYADSESQRDFYIHCHAQNQYHL